MSHKYLLVALFAVYIGLVWSEGSDLKIEVIDKEDRCARRTTEGDTVTVEYTAKYADNTPFDMKEDKRVAKKFVLGAGKAIKGWEQGLLYMCAGETRRLTVPPHLSFWEKKDEGKTIIFEIELLRVKERSKRSSTFAEMDADKDNYISKEELSEFMLESKRKENMDAEDDSLHKDLVKDLLRHKDKDRDGRISRKEFMGPRHDEL